MLYHWESSRHEWWCISRNVFEVTLGSGTSVGPSSKDLHIQQCEEWRISGLIPVFIITSFREGDQTGHEYSSLLRIMDLYRVIIVLCDLSENTLITQFAILFALATASLTCIDHFRSELRWTPRSFSWCDGQISWPEEVIYCWSSDVKVRNWRRKF